MSNVLIVEDYKSINDLYVEMFSRAGFTVETAKSGAEAIKKTQAHEFDAIVLDMLMLELSGTDFLREFEPAKHPHTKIFAVSNLDSPGVIEKAKELGAVDYFIKSQYTPQQLVEAVQARLNQK